VYQLSSRLVATTISKPTDLSKQYLHRVELDDVDEMQIGHAAFTLCLLVPALGAIPLGLAQPVFEDLVFYGLAAIILVSGFRGLYLLFPLIIAVWMI
jgi:hypothetical protein